MFSGRKVRRFWEAASRALRASGQLRRGFVARTLQSPSIPMTTPPRWGARKPKFLETIEGNGAVGTNQPDGSQLEQPTSGEHLFPSCRRSVSGGCGAYDWEWRGTCRSSRRIPPRKLAVVVINPEKTRADSLIDPSRLHLDVPTTFIHATSRKLALRKIAGGLGRNSSRGHDVMWDPRPDDVKERLWSPVVGETDSMSKGSRSWRLERPNGTCTGHLVHLEVAALKRTPRENERGWNSNGLCFNRAAPGSNSGIPRRLKALVRTVQRNRMFADDYSRIGCHRPFGGYLHVQGISLFVARFNRLADSLSTSLCDLDVFSFPCDERLVKSSRRHQDWVGPRLSNWSSGPPPTHDGDRTGR